MKAFEIRNMSDQEIQTRLEETYEELFNLRFQQAVGQARDSNRVKLLKRDIARLKTVLNERKLVVAE
jgi:large subunit ribosomal protein L29